VGSLYRLLADHGQQIFPDGYFADLYAARQVMLMPGSDPPDKLYIAIDGTGVPMVAAETEGGDGKGEDGFRLGCSVPSCATEWLVQPPERLTGIA